ncbi:MAG: gas vesicle protein [Armatimonadetes bacterium]|nr:gas vesicle protein [Armatimonadota bacterium]
MAVQRATTHSLESTSLADLLERVLDKGLVIAGDIKVNLVDVELLTIQIRLLVCSVDRAREMGIDWWSGNAFLSGNSQQPAGEASLGDIEERLARLERAAFSAPSGSNTRGD